MKNYLFLNDAQYIPKEVNGFPETMKGSGTPITTTCIKPSFCNDGFIRETSPGIYPQRQEQYVNIKIK